MEKGTERLTRSRIIHLG